MAAAKPDPTQNALDFERPIVELEQKIVDLERLAEQTHMDLTQEVKPLRELRDKLLKQIFSSLTPWRGSTRWWPEERVTRPSSAPRPPVTAAASSTFGGSPGKRSNGIDARLRAV